VGCYFARKHCNLRDTIEKELKLVEEWKKKVNAKLNKDLCKNDLLLNLLWCSVVPTLIFIDRKLKEFESKLEEPSSQAIA
jgi:hypothetical protein